MILPMVEVQLLGPRDLLSAALAFLQREGVLQLRGPDADGGAPHGAVHPCPPSPDADALARRLEETMARAAALSARLPPARANGDREILPAVGSPELLARLDALGTELDRLTAARAALREEAASTARFAGLVGALAPLDHALDPALEPELHLLVLRHDPDALALLESEVRRLTDGRYELAARPLDAAQVALRLTVPRASGHALTSLLFDRGVEEVKLPARYGGRTPFEILLLLAARGRLLPEEIAAADRAVARFAARVGAPLAEVGAAARAALARLRAEARCGETRFAFVVSGWMPAERVPALRADLDAAWGDRLVLFAHPPAPARWGEVPVVLRNPAAFRPFQLLLGLVPLPRYGSLDPTPWIAVGFPLLFGLVLGDVVFGILGLAVAGLAAWKGWGGERGRDVAVVAMACSACALVFGFAFGEALGELGAHVGLRPILLDRRHAIMAFFAGTVALGAVHVVLGSALGILNAVRGGHTRHAIGRAAKLALFAAAGVWIAVRFAWLPPWASTPALAFGGIALACAVACEGPMAALDVVLGIGNVLSYARLMALGLASVMLAEVANTIAATVGPAPVGIAIGVLLHAVNFTLGLISPTVAALRLHYVEFFEKFYDEGGVPYRPFALAS